MEKNFFNSRSVIIDPIFKKSLSKNYDHHKKRLEQIKSRKSEQDTDKHQQIIKRKLSQKACIDKVHEQLSPTPNNKRSLINHIGQIINRKEQTFSEFKRYKNKFLENEKQQIEKQNKILRDKIMQNLTCKITKKELKKQFKQYQSQKSLLRKVHYQSSQPKRKKEKSQQTYDRDHK